MPTSSNGKQGRLIVIDGTDGTGKTTQTMLLVKRLRAAGKRVALADFPRYGLPSAHFVEQYLNGRYGSAASIDPHAASLFYALDRYDARRTLEKELAAGKIIISNRYVSANIGHQGGKIPAGAKRRKFFTWLDWLEHDLLGLPRPNRTFLLHMPAEIAQRLVDRKGRRDYIRRKRDIHEADLSHLKSAEQTFLAMGKQFPNFTVIECMEKERLLSPLEIHEKIWNTVRTLT